MPSIPPHRRTATSSHIHLYSRSRSYTRIGSVSTAQAAFEQFEVKNPHLFQPRYHQSGQVLWSARYVCLIWLLPYLNVDGVQVYNCNIIIICPPAIHISTIYTYHGADDISLPSLSITSSSTPESHTLNFLASSSNWMSAPSLEELAPRHCAIKSTMLTPTMSTYKAAPSPSPSPPLSLLVLLPKSAHVPRIASPSGPPDRPSPLVPRQSGSTGPRLKPQSLTKASNDGTANEEMAEIDKVVSAGRRLSLAPGMGAGIRLWSAGTFSPTTIIVSPPDSSHHASTSASIQPTTTAFSSAVPTFGSTSPLPGQRSPRRRPQTAAVASPTFGPGLVGGGVSRGSIAVPGGGAMLGDRRKTRPGWEGDEVVNMLRGSGMEGKLGITGFFWGIRYP